MSSHSSRNQFVQPQRLKKTLPINLLKKLRREQRIHNGGVGRNRRRNAKKQQRRKREENFEISELDALTHASELQLKEILANEELLSDIQFDVSPEELEGEISLANGGGTTIYVQRDGLSTLTIVLPQEDPTISQLKRAIEVQARVQLKRELRERQEERQKRRQQYALLPTVTSTRSHVNTAESSKTTAATTPVACCDTNESLLREKYNKSVRLTGELVCSTTHNGHQHRPNVSWRFLWRAYALFNLATKSLVNDENGRKLLSECGIENAQTLKFTKREKYRGKRRQ